MYAFFLPAAAPHHSVLLVALREKKIPIYSKGPETHIKKFKALRVSDKRAGK
jgi:hypothetical protein